jgi:hypothetical protein
MTPFPIYLLYMVETKLNQRIDDGEIKRQINLDRYGRIQVPNIRHLPHPPLVLITDHIQSYWPKLSDKEIFMWKPSNPI